MQLADFDYVLPPELIAQAPLPQRSHSRLLIVEKSTLRDQYFYELPKFLNPSDVLIFNDTRVIPARLFANKASGGAVEILIERLIDTHRALAHLRVSRKPAIGSFLYLNQGYRLQFVGRRDDLFELASAIPFAEVLVRHGQTPLPPYVERPPDELDSTRYQTVYATHPGAIAAPTAGLHFDESLLKTLQIQGIEYGFVTLHIGAGTFQPVRADNVRQHQMHSEWLQISEATVDLILAAKTQHRRIIAVGTTVVRALETAALSSGVLQPFTGESQLFIYPGFPFRVVDGLITNFHLPRSTLLMLVSAMIGRERLMASYAHAIAQKYRFFSYGDAMFIPQRESE